MVSRIETTPARMIISVTNQVINGAALNQSHYVSALLHPVDILGNSNLNVFNPQNLSFQIELGNLSNSVPVGALNYNQEFYSKYLLAVEGPWMGEHDRVPCADEPNSDTCVAYNQVGKTCFTCNPGSKVGAVR
jgi:hypothetical protein